MKTKQICSGVQLCSHKTEQFKTSIVTLNIITPLDDNAAKKALLINLLARTNMNYPSISAMNRKLATLYGAAIAPKVNKIGEAQVLSLSLVCIDNRFALKGESILEEGLELLLDCLFKPDITTEGFKDENLTREKRLLKEKIDSENDDKIAYALKRMFEEMCCDEAYSINRLGNKNDIDSISGKDVFVLWKQLLLGSAFQINVTGNFDEEKIEYILKNRFEALERKKQDITEIRTEFITESYDVKTVKEKQKVQQGKLVLGFRAGMTYDLDNYAAIHLMTAIFGTGTFSKLFTNVREKMSLCYYCSARLIRSKGIIMVQSGVETENTQKALEAILEEFEQMKKGNFSNGDILAAKLSIIDSIRSSMDSVASIDSWFLTQCVSGEFCTPEENIKMIENVSYEEIVLAANMVTLDTVYILESEQEVE